MVNLAYAIKVLEAYSKEPRPFANLKTPRDGFLLALRILRGMHKASLWQSDDKDRDEITPMGPGTTIGPL